MSVKRKPAPADAPILEPIVERWSPVAIGSKPVEQEKIDTFFEAARWAPSSYNEQPWHYLYATKEDGEDREKIESLLSEGNAWAKNAYILIIDFYKKTFEKNGKENRVALHDLGAANAYLVLQLQPLGLMGHQMGGFDHAKANEVLGVPDDFYPGSVTAIGYYDEDIATEEMKKRESSERVRKPRASFVHQKKW